MNLPAEARAARAAASDDTRKRLLVAALEASGGNITRAARALSLSRTHAARLVRRFDLAEWARDVRASTGASSTGRPPKATP